MTEHNYEELRASNHLDLGRLTNMELCEGCGVVRVTIKGEYSYFRPGWASPEEPPCHKINHTCNECGRSTAPGSGLFADRVPSFDDVETHEEMGKPFPEGGFICRECEAKINARS